MFKITIYSLYDIIMEKRFGIEPDDSFSYLLDRKIPHFKLENLAVLGKTFMARASDDRRFYELVAYHPPLKVPHWLCKDIICANCTKLVQ